MVLTASFRNRLREESREEEGSEGPGEARDEVGGRARATTGRREGGEEWRVAARFEEGRGGEGRPRGCGESEERRGGVYALAAARQRQRKARAMEDRSKSRNVQGWA